VTGIKQHNNEINDSGEKLRGELTNPTLQTSTWINLHDIRWVNSNI